MSDLAAYRALEARLVKELEEWANQTRESQQHLHSHTGGRCVADYVDDYAYKFAIVAHLASDLGHPDANLWIEDFYVFADLQGLLD